MKVFHQEVVRVVLLDTRYRCVYVLEFAMSSVRKFPFLGCSRKTRCALFGTVVAALLIVSSGFAGELGSLCSAAKDFVSAAKAQEGVVITYPTAGELAASTMAYAVGKKRYFAELRSALPILIAIGLKERPETAEVEEFRSAFRLLDWEEERRVAKATAEILKGFENDQAVAVAEKEFNEAQEIEAAFDTDFDGLDAA